MTTPPNAPDAIVNSAGSASALAFVISNSISPSRLDLPSRLLPQAAAACCRSTSIVPLSPQPTPETGRLRKQPSARNPSPALQTDTGHWPPIISAQNPAPRALRPRARDTPIFYHPFQRSRRRNSSIDEVP